MSNAQIEAIYAQCVKTSQFITSPKVKAIFEENMHKLGEALEALPEPTATTPTETRVIEYRTKTIEIESVEMKKRLAILEQERKNKLENVRTWQCTQDLRFCFAAAASCATKPHFAAQLRSMIALHVRQPQLTWEQLIDQCPLQTPS